MYGVTEFVVNSHPVAQPSAISVKDPDRWATMFDTDRKTSAGVSVNHRTTIGYPPFWRGVNLLANGVGGLPVDVYRRTGDDRRVANTHPARKLLRKRANTMIHARKLRKTQVAHACLFGNSYAIIERDAAMRPRWMWLLDPQKVIIREIDGELWYATTIGNKPAKFPGRDIFHLSGLTHNGVKGYSAIDIFAESIGLGLAAQKFGAKFFGDGTHTSGVVMVPGHFSDEAIRNTLNAWDEMQTGMKNAHKIALLQDGVKYQQMTTDPDAAQFLETRTFEVRDVARILGLPLHLLGDTETNSHNSLESEEASYLTKSLNPWLQDYEDECEMKLLTERENDNDTHFVEFNREAAVQMEFEKKINGLYRQVEMGMLDIDEARRKLNMPSIGDDGKRRFRPANWIGLGEETAVAEPEPALDDTDDSDTSVLRALIASSVTTALAVEQRKLKVAIKKTETFQDFTGFCDTFYTAWVTDSIPDLNSPQAVQVKVAHAEESKRQLAEVASCSITAALPDQIAGLVATWSDRGEILTDKLMGTI